MLSDRTNRYYYDDIGLEFLRMILSKMNIKEKAMVNIEHAKKTKNKKWFIKSNFYALGKKQ